MATIWRMFQFPELTQHFHHFAVGDYWIRNCNVASGHSHLAENDPTEQSILRCWSIFEALNPITHDLGVEIGSQYKIYMSWYIKAFVCQPLSPHVWPCINVDRGLWKVSHQPTDNETIRSFDDLVVDMWTEFKCKFAFGGLNSTQTVYF